MADRARHGFGLTSLSGGDAGFTHASPPFLGRVGRRCVAALGLIALAATPRLVQAQASRAWQDWRTIETEHFVVHFPERYRAWTIALTERLEGVRGQVANVVGFLPRRRVNVVVDDPSNDANGTAYTALDAPTIVLWPTPPDPREEIGNFRVWGELLATHELAHIAHLTRPSRNHWRQLLWDLSPVPLSPIAANAPRWALEGYATYVEGRVTGTGRPNHAWRSAILRQFALEGRLPGYYQLNGSSGWEGGSFAYLGGSAFIEWLARREGDSSVTALWQRMTAKTTRSFDDAFLGVYGGGPSELYSRFAAELTADALAFERALARTTLVPGTLVQRLSRKTGDPAVSPDGRFIALVVRRENAPSEVVVWGTADEPDTLAERRRDALLKRDPDDVANRSFYPRPKRVIISLAANDGASFEGPRWLPDNKRVLLTRHVPMPDGTLRPDLYIWSAEDGALGRVTRGAAVRDADSSPDGRWAAAVRCDRGWCDLVRVDLAMGAVRVLAQGSLERNYYRPRVSKRTGEIAVAEQSGDRWRIARVNPENGAITYADPDDGVNRFDATYEPDGRTLIATSEAGGIANLERLDPDNRRATRLTSVTGAAVAADVAPDGTLWFLSLQANGYDLRRLRPDSASIARAGGATDLHRLSSDSLSPVFPPRRSGSENDQIRRPAVGPVGDERGYGAGPSRFRYLPSLSTGYGGSTAQVAIVRTDPVGRLGVSLQGSVGAGSLPAGAALEIALRQWRTAIIGNAWTSHEASSRQFPPAYDEGLDLTRIGGGVRFQRIRANDGGELHSTLALFGERLLPSALTFETRAAAVASFTAVARQRDQTTRYQEQLATHLEAGTIGADAYLRQRSSLFFGTGSGSRPLASVRLAFGTVGGAGSIRERFAIGGFASPLMDPIFDARRVDAPAYPVASATSMTFTSFRAAVPLSSFELFYSGAGPDLVRAPLRSYGIEARERIAAISALGTPEVQILAGFARAVDAPVTGEWRYYVSIAVRP